MTESERFPLLTDEGRRMLRWLEEHPHAPRYNHRCGDRLDRAGLGRVRAFAAELETAPRGWRSGELPAWLSPFVGFCLAEVPFYRRRGGGGEFADIPTCSRADLAREPWSLVPDQQPLDDLMVHATSGTTGNQAVVLTHPLVNATYVPLIQRALAGRGVRLEGGSGRVSIVQ